MKEVDLYASRGHSSDIGVVVVGARKYVLLEHGSESEQVRRMFREALLPEIIQKTIV